MRVTWADRLQNADTREKLSLVVTFIDSTTAGYLRYGSRVATTWATESAGAGAEIPVEEVRRMIDASNETEWPIFEAYEDIIDHGIELIAETREVPVGLEDLLREYRDHNEEVFSAVMYPNGGLADYDQRIRELTNTNEELRQRVRDEIARL
jgi:hypothetical protein